MIKISEDLTLVTNEDRYFVRVYHTSCMEPSRRRGYVCSYGKFIRGWTDSRNCDSCSMRLTDVTFDKIKFIVETLSD